MYSYAQAETILAGMYDARLEQAGAFRGRLKNLKRFGIPLGVSPGSGAKISYDEEHLFQWALCLEFMQFNVDPSWIAKLVHQHWKIIKSTCFDPAVESVLDEDNDLFLRLTPQFMSEGWAVSRGERTAEAFLDLGVTRRGEADKLLGNTGRSLRRRCLINISELIREIRREAGVVCPPAPPPLDTETRKFLDENAPARRKRA